MNGPPTFGDVIALVLLLNLPRLNGAKPIRFLQFAIAFGALTLTEVRSAWIALIAGALTFILCSPNRLRNLCAFGGLIALCGVVALNLSLFLGSANAGNVFQSRIDTFADLNNDVSFNERARYYGDPLIAGLTNPLGVGLGLVGTAAKLGPGEKTKDFDNGYIARLTEMGFFGTACYVFVLGGAFMLAVRRRREFRQGGQGDLVSIASAVIATQVALLFLDISGDHHNAFEGVLFWLSLAFVAGRGALAELKPVRA